MAEQDPKVPGKTTPPPKPVEDKVADTTKSAADQAANEVKGVRAEFRAIRNDEDVKHVAQEAKPFLAGAAFAAAMVVDPPLALAYGIYKGGRAIQSIRNRRHEDEVITTDES